MSLEVKTHSQLRLMRRAGLVVAAGLEAMQSATVAGISTAEIDAIGRQVLAAHNATSNFLGYGAQSGVPFPGVACISVNSQIVHGVPGSRVIRPGDLVSIDFGAVVEGWHADAARSFIVGTGTPGDSDLVSVTTEALWAGIGAAKAGVRVGEISRAIQRRITRESYPYGIVREYTGHGIGTAMHMEPDVPNVHRALSRRSSPTLPAGTVIAIEPMVTLGSRHTVVEDDQWTVTTKDGSRSAHVEHSVAIVETGISVLTAADGGKAECQRRGIAFVSLDGD